RAVLGQHDHVGTGHARERTVGRGGTGHRARVGRRGVHAAGRRPAGYTGPRKALLPHPSASSFSTASLSSCPPAKGISRYGMSRAPSRSVTPASTFAVMYSSERPYTSVRRAARNRPATWAPVRSRSGGNSPPHRITRSIRDVLTPLQRLPVAAPCDDPSPCT